MGDMRNIVVVPYNPAWPAMFQQEADKLSAVFGQACLAIHHIGSTAIPGMRAKPIIDIMPVVPNLEQLETLTPAMIQLGYEPKGENGIPGRRYFVKGADDHRTHHVHTYEPDNPEVIRHLSFRDYLIAHPEAAEQYASLKETLAQEYSHDIFGYMAGKDDFIKETLQKALKWYGNG
jgi:GrpB-like predicted nucleotidyltransferase (UPF0157 family)